MPVLRPAAALAILLGLVIGLSACGQTAGPAFDIVSGSENQPLEPLVQEFCKERRATCTMTYQGSLDIGLALKPGQDVKFDAVWPASGIWVAMFDTGRRVSALKSISQSPVVLGARKSKAEALGWTKGPVSMADILAAVESGKLRFLMTSATQSNSGASAYIAMLSAALGSKAVLSEADLSGASADMAARLLRGVERSSGSSGWLAELYLTAASKGLIYDAMWNYESVIKETNDKLRTAGKELLWAVYPSDGVAMSDSPLGFVERGRGPEVRQFFDDLQAWLLTPETQARIAQTGRRVPAERAAAARPEPDWNFDPQRLVTAVPLPEPAVIRKALVLYQEALRRPSLSVLCLDFSGSMKGDGENALQRAMEFLLTPQQASEVLIQWSPRDRIIVIPFTSGVAGVWEGSGQPLDQAKILAQVQSMHAEGGTNMYACAAEGLRRMAALKDRENYLPAIVVMTDGRSEGDPQAFLSTLTPEQRAVPIFGITFGDADRGQLDALTAATSGRVFDGVKDLTGAFRSARGYN
jgi:Ca-activated chloride channel family protein